MKYFISFKNPLTHFFTVRLELEGITSDKVMLQLPIWRPGRYEAANFAKNVRGLKITGKDHVPVDFVKKTPSSWEVNTSNKDHIIVTYDYFAFKMDAGNSWYDEDQVYINFINCMIYDPDRIDDTCTVELELGGNYQVGCGLTRAGNKLLAKDYYELVDSPLIASPYLEHYQYQVAHHTFHIWIYGQHNMDREKLVKDFNAFSSKQVLDMGEFPEKDYHFLLQILPYKAYHGVEHHDSTIICLGPGQTLDLPDLYNQLLGVSSHELFHAWNIIKIRPAEIMPYRFNQEVFFPTGFVAEGFTTYFGDLFLVRSGVFGKEAFFNEMNTLFRRHFSNFGRLNYSVTDSSLDLWIDGYAVNAPDRKSSIYVEGAMIALCLDLMIRRNSQNKRSLIDVMKILWHRHGKTSVGYSYAHIQEICEEIYGESLDDFFKNHVKGTAPKEELINELLNHVGCKLSREDAESNLEKYFGLRISNTNGNLKVLQIAPGSIGEKHFSVNDELLEINGHKLDIEVINQFGAQPYEFLIKRNYKEITVQLQPTDETYLHQYLIEQIDDPSAEQCEAFKKWTGASLKS